MPELMRKDLAEALGVTPATVTRDAAAGMPTHDVRAAREWRLQNRRARVAPPPRLGDAPPPEGASAAGPAVLPDDPKQQDDYWTSRARREAAEAETAELKLAELRKGLVRQVDVRACYAKRAAGLREALLQIPSRLSAVLAAESDQARCSDMLEQELHLVLRGLVDKWREDV